MVARTSLLGQKRFYIEEGISSAIWERVATPRQPTGYVLRGAWSQNPHRAGQSRAMRNRRDGDGSEWLTSQFLELFHLGFPVIRDNMFPHSLSQCMSQFSATSLQDHPNRY